VRAVRPVVTGLAACALAAGLQGPAPAATVPSKFLTGDQIPTTNRFGPWDETKINTGVRDRESCAQKALPRTTTRVRIIFESGDGPGEMIFQYAVRMPTVADAKKLEARLTYCGSKAYGDAQPTEPGGKYAYRTLGDFPVENGLLVRAKIYTHPEYHRSIHLDAVGRDGRHVMWLNWAFRTDGKVPVDTWTKVSKKALSQLRP
jgi:hypothetical protein